MPETTTPLDTLRAKYRSTTPTAAPRAAATFRERSIQDLADLANSTQERASLSQGRDDETSNEMAQIISERAKGRVEMARRMVQYQGYQTKLSDLLKKHHNPLRTAQLWVGQRVAPEWYADKIGELAGKDYIV